MSSPRLAKIQSQLHLCGVANHHNHIHFSKTSKLQPAAAESTHKINVQFASSNWKLPSRDSPTLCVGRVTTANASSKGIRKCEDTGVPTTANSYSTYTFATAGSLSVSGSSTSPDLRRSQMPSSSPIVLEEIATLHGFCVPNMMYLQVSRQNAGCRKRLQRSCLAKCASPLKWQPDSPKPDWQS